MHTISLARVPRQLFCVNQHKCNTPVTMPDLFAQFPIRSWSSFFDTKAFALPKSRYAAAPHLAACNTYVQFAEMQMPRRFLIDLPQTASTTWYAQPTNTRSAHSLSGQLPPSGCSCIFVLRVSIIICSFTFACTCVSGVCTISLCSLLISFVVA